MHTLSLLALGGALVLSCDSGSEGGRPGLPAGDAGPEGLEGEGEGEGPPNPAEGEGEGEEALEGEGEAPVEGEGEGAAEGEGEGEGAAEGEGEEPAEGEGEGEGPAEGEGEPVAWDFAGARSVTTDGPSQVTVFWAPASDPADGDARFEYLLHWAGARRDLDRRAEPAFVAGHDALRGTIEGLPDDGTVWVTVHARDAAGRIDRNDAALQVATQLPELRPELSWESEIFHPSHSSPGLGDFDGDGVLDIVVGSGRENVGGEVVALSGADGDEIWTVRVGNEVVGSSLVMDVGGEGQGVPDVLIGGRDPVFLALDGTSGEEIWSRVTNAWCATPTAIEIDDDGVLDILLATGGLELPNRPQNEREPGRVWFLSGATGQELGSHVSDDGTEYYASTAVADLDGEGGLEVVFGSGGHEYGGDVMVLSLDAEDLDWSATSGNVSGFLASPALADLDGDGLPDVVIGSEDAFAAAYRGTDGRELWRWTIPGHEIMASPSVGWADRSGIPSVAVAASRGDFLEGYQAGVTTVRNGRTGEQLWERRVEDWYVVGTPLWVDLTGNGLDDLILSEIVFDDELGARGRLLFLHGATGAPLATLDLRAAGWATPTVADLDGDGSLDLTWAGIRYPDPEDPNPNGGVITGIVLRVGLGVPVPDRGISWAGFRADPRNTGALSTLPPR
jgi:outer membrane protein assembly factor BamB